ncbi:dihydrolipoyl dehydrogenase [Endozoicomonadaceae bacterium StTr2]
MKQITTDIAIIGGGTAGLGAFRAARKHTDQLVLIEGGAYGTTCARVGCMPSKLLIAAAETAHSCCHATPFGVNVKGPVEIDGAAVMKRVREERDRFVGFVLDSVDDIPAEHKLQGHAQFIDDHTLQVGDDVQVNARKIVIATGSRPVWPGFFNQAGDRLIVNDHVFDWDNLPESVAVFGPGVIGLELGQALHRLGVRVRLFGVGGQIGPISDPDILQQATMIFSDEFALDADSQVHAISRTDDKVEINFELDGRPVTEAFDYLLAATGRKPNVDNLGLENTSLDLNDKGIPEFDPWTLQAGESPIFIAGDANNYIPLLHEAADEGRIAGDNAGRYPEVRAGQRRTPISVVFTDPQIAMAGESLQQLRTRYGKCGCFEVGEVDFIGQGRSRVMLKNKGKLRVYGENGTGRLLGAEMIGPAAEHLAHLLAWSIQQQMTVSQVLEMPFYHPVIEEGVRTALRDLNAKLRLGPKMVAHCLDCGPGA